MKIQVIWRILVYKRLYNLFGEVKDINYGLMAIFVFLEKSVRFKVSINA